MKQLGRPRLEGQEARPLDPSLYVLNDEEIAFFKAQTGIQDDTLLRNHIIEVQTEAYAVYPYPCIRLFFFTRFRISKHPAYQRALKLGQDRKDGILLDLGCCMGSDIRKAIADGFPRENVIASDLHAGFWPLGHKLFKTTQETFPVPFIAGDILDAGFLPATPSLAVTSFTPPYVSPLLSNLTSLAPLQHRLSVIYTSSVFHLYGEEKQYAMARRIGTLLSQSPGSMIFGMHIGAADTEENRDGGKWMNYNAKWTFAHSSTSWKRLWVGEGRVFKPGDAVVEVSTKEIPQMFDYLNQRDDAPHSNYLLYWNVTRM